MGLASHSYKVDTIQDFFDQFGNQTVSARIENRQTYQNYEKAPQSFQNVYVLSKSFFGIKNQSNLSDI